MQVARAAGAWWALEVPVAISGVGARGGLLLELKRQEVEETSDGDPRATGITPSVASR